jgi:large subunit ribosomal protein L21
MYAVIETGGKQYRVSKDEVIDIERLKDQTSDDVVFSSVLLMKNDKTLLDQKELEKCTVKGKILSEEKDKKGIAYKYKRRKNYSRKVGFRHIRTRVKITEISMGGN